ncbi:MAG: DUF1501 domain-containing protein [Chloroflexi bacterium]|nr:DUF1501 domain-containing protein [Chloroflexota bacterium]
MITKTASRREFTKTLGMAGVVGLSSTLFPRWMPRMAFRPKRQTTPGDVLVVIFQRGGMDGLNVVVPFGEGANYYDRRPTIAIPEPDGSDQTALDLDGFFGLHPALKPLHDVYQTGQLAVVHAAGSPDPSRSHFDAMEFMERGTPGEKTTMSGWVNRHLQSSAWLNDSPFRAIGMGTMVPSSLRGSVSALALQSIADFHLSGRDDQLAVVQRTLAGLYSVAAPSDALGIQAAEVFASSDVLVRLGQAGYIPQYDAAYPDSDFGRGLQQIAQLIKSNVGLEVACVDSGGWDTHEDEGGVDGYLAGNLSDLGQGLAAFYTDLQDYMANVTVVTMSEFGRRVDENASGGTDHGHGNCMFVMGGGVNGGVYADWPGLQDEALDDGDVSITTDYRDVLSEILMKRVMNPAIDQIFPNYTPNARGIVVAR